MTKPSPPPLTERERSGLRHSITEDVRELLRHVPADAPAWRAQHALFRAGLALPLPVVVGWLQVVRDEHTNPDKENPT